VSRARGMRTVVTDHGLQGGNWGGLLPRLFDAFLLVSEYSAHELRAPASKTRVIFGGADPLRFAPMDSESRRGVLFVGRVPPHKGGDRLIRALPPGALLTIVGSSAPPPKHDYPDLLRQLAADKDVCFVENVPDADLPRLYRSAAVMVLPS